MDPRYFKPKFQYYIVLWKDFVTGFSLISTPLGDDLRKEGKMGVVKDLL